MVEVTFLSFTGALIIGAIAALLGGALGGAWVAHGHMEKSLGAWMGSFYGPLGAIPGLLLGLIFLALVGG